MDTGELLRGDLKLATRFPGQLRISVTTMGYDGFYTNYMITIVTIITVK